jgi:hypothetical protein
MNLQLMVVTELSNTLGQWSCRKFLLVDVNAGTGFMV